MLRVSQRTVERMLHDGALSFARVRGQVRIPVAAIQELVSAKGTDAVVRLRAQLAELERVVEQL